MTPKTLMMQINKTLPGLDNFYMVGQWVNASGSMAMMVVSRGILYKLSVKREKKKFVTSTP